MKQKNMPARKLKRQLLAQRENRGPWTKEEVDQLEEARHVRTKKARGSMPA